MVARQPLMSSHMVFDHATNNLYIAEGATGRILVLDTTSGSPGGIVTPNYDGSVQTKMDGATLTPLISDAGEDIGLWNPSGLEIQGGHLYVVDNPTSTIFAPHALRESASSSEPRKSITPPRTTIALTASRVPSSW